MNKKLLVGIAISACLLTPAIALAHMDSDDTTTSTNTEQESELRDAQEHKQQATIDQIKDRLEGARLKMCQHRQTEIDKNISNGKTAAQRHFDVFTKIADRVMTFAVNKNRKPANYDALVADINAKKVAAQAAIDAASAIKFECTSSSPKGQVTAFRATMSTVRDALKAYRTSIKNLIVAVKATPATSEETK